MKHTIFSLLILLTHITMNTPSVAQEIMDRIKTERTSFEALGKIYPVEKSVKIDKTQIAGVNCYWFIPEKLSSENIIVYLHGGGFSLGSIESHRALVSLLSNTTGHRILFIEYSLAPEHPYPAAINEVVAVYKMLDASHKGVKLIFMGDSAGGTLAVTAINALVKEGFRIPDAAILISALINFKCNNNSYQTRQELDPILTKAYILDCIRNYLQENGDAEANPSEIVFKSFPPLLALVGTNEILYDDSKNFHEYISTIQPHSEFKAYQDQTHVWLLTNKDSVQVKESLKDITAFLESIQ